MLIVNKQKNIKTTLLILSLLLGGLYLLIVNIPKVLAEREILFPVLGGGAYRDDYLAGRPDGQHNAIDIFANKHTPLVAVSDGTITYVGYPQPSWGYMIQITDSDGYKYNYIHINNDTPGTDDGNGGGMNAYAADMKRGNRVVKGQLVGWLGDSGNAEETSAHLHFEMINPQGVPTNPYDALVRAPIKYTINRSEYPQLSNENLPYGLHEGGVNITTGNFDSDSATEIVTGAGIRGGPHIKMYESDMSFRGKEFFAYDVNFRGGSDVAAGDVDGDGTDEVITGAGPGGGPHVKVFTANGSEIASFFAYDPNFDKGIYVAAGDVDGDGTDEIITGPGAGGGPNVKIFKYDGGQLGSFFAYDEGFKGGVDVAVGDVVGDSTEEIVTSAGPGGGPHVRILTYTGSSNTPVKHVASFFAYDANSYHGGVRVSVGNVKKSSVKAEILTAPNSNGGPHVKMFSGSGIVVGDTMFMEQWWYGFHDIAAGDGFGLAGTGVNRRASIRQAF